MPQHCTVHDPGPRRGRFPGRRIVGFMVVLAVVLIDLSGAQAGAAGAAVRPRRAETLVNLNRTVYEAGRSENASPVLVQLENDVKVVRQGGARSDTGGSEPAGRVDIDGPGRLPTENQHARGPPGGSRLLPVLFRSSTF